MRQITDKVQIIESILEHLSQNEDSFLQAAQDYLGYDISLNPRDPDTVIIHDQLDEPTTDTIYGALCYA